MKYIVAGIIVLIVIILLIIPNQKQCKTYKQSICSSSDCNIWMPVDYGNGFTSLICIEWKTREYPCDVCIEYVE